MDTTQLNIIIRAIDEASAGIAKVGESLKALGAISDEVNAQIARGSEASAKSLENVSATAKIEATSLRALGAAAIEGSAGVDKIALANDRVIVSNGKLSTAVDGLLASIKEEATGLRALGAAAIEGSGGIDKVAVANDRAAASTRRIATTAEAGGLSMGKLGVGVAAAGVGIGYLIYKTTKSAAEFQTLMTKLVTSAGESEGNLKMVSDGVLNVARTTGIASTELANAMYYVESAGFHGANGLKVLMAAAKGARDEQADATTVTDAASTVLNSYALSADKSAQVVNGMITAVSRGKTTLQLFSSSLSSVLPIASAVGISFAQVAGAIATMTAQGMTAQQATQDLRHTIQSLSNPSNVQTKEMLQLGISSQEVAKNLGKEGLTNTIERLSDAILSRMGPSGLVLQKALQNSVSATQDLKEELAVMPDGLQRVAKELLAGTISWKDYRKAIRDMSPANETLGQQFENTFTQAHSFNTQLKAGTPAALSFEAALSKATGGSTGLTTALMLTGAHTQTFNDNVNAVSKSMGTATDKVLGWKEMQGTLNQQMSELHQNLSTIGIALGTAFIPVLLSMTKALVEILKPIADFITYHKKLAAAIILTTIAIVGFTGAVIAAKKAEELFMTVKLALGFGKNAEGALLATKAITKLGGNLGSLVGISRSAAGATSLAAEANGLLGSTAAEAGGAAGLGALGAGALIAGAALAGLGTAFFVFNKWVKPAEDHILGINKDIKSGTPGWDQWARSMNFSTSAAQNLAGAHRAVDKATNTLTNDQQLLTKLQGQSQKATDAYSRAQDTLNKDIEKYGADSPIVQKQQQIVNGLAQTSADKLNAVARQQSIVNADTDAYKDALKNSGNAQINYNKLVDTTNQKLGSMVDKIATLKATPVVGITLKVGTQLTGIKISGPASQGTTQLNLLNAMVGGGSKGGAFAQSGFVGNMQMSGSIQGNFGNLQSNKKGTPHFAGGVENFKGGLALVGEKGPELVNLPSGSSVISSNETQQIINSSQSMLAKTVTGFTQIGKDIITGLINGIRGETGFVVTAMKDIGVAIQGGLKNTLGIHSPSSIFAEIGQNIDAGLQKGLMSGKQSAVKTATDLGVSTAAGVRQGAGQVGSVSGNKVSGGTPMVGELHIHLEGPIMGNQQQAQQLATTIYQSLQQIARQHGTASSLPSIGIRPI
jgi:hypothetical protein